jgi:hypothetical protein
MNCTLATLLTCFHLSGIYVDSGLSIDDAGVWVYREERTRYMAPWSNCCISEESSEHRSDYTRNPYGHLALGYQLDLGRYIIHVDAAHESSIATNKDRGINSFEFGVRWFPFR